jgi:DNA-binding PucR family transcriptional regulator
VVHDRERRCEPLRRRRQREAVDRMFLHRNSLLYRLERIQGLTGLDLKYPGVALALQLGLLALDKGAEPDETEHP